MPIYYHKKKTKTNQYYFIVNESTSYAESRTKKARRLRKIKVPTLSEETGPENWIDLICKELDCYSIKNLYHYFSNNEFLNEKDILHALEILQSPKASPSEKISACNRLIENCAKFTGKNYDESIQNWSAAKPVNLPHYFMKTYGEELQLQALIMKNKLNAQLVAPSRQSVGRPASSWKEKFFNWFWGLFARNKTSSSPAAGARPPSNQKRRQQLSSSTGKIAQQTTLSTETLKKGILKWKEVISDKFQWTTDPIKGDKYDYVPEKLVIIALNELDKVIIINRCPKKKHLQKAYSQLYHECSKVTGKVYDEATNSYLPMKMNQGSEEEAVYQGYIDSPAYEEIFILQQQVVTELLKLLKTKSKQKNNPSPLTKKSSPNSSPSSSPPSSAHPSRSASPSSDEPSSPLPVVKERRRSY